MVIREFRWVTFGDVTPGDRARFRKNLEDDCSLGTLRMVWIVEALKGLADGGSRYSRSKREAPWMRITIGRFDYPICPGFSGEESFLIDQSMHSSV